MTYVETAFGDRHPTVAANVFQPSPAASLEVIYEQA